MIKLKYSYILFIFITLYITSTKVQSQELDKKLNLQIIDKAFFDNIEFDMPQIEGFTIIGNRLTGTINYSINQNFSMYAGIHILKYSGLEGFEDLRTKPLIGLNVKPINDLSITIGSFNVESRNLPSPLYNVKHKLKKYIEEGVQIQYHSHKYNSYLWLDWQQFIFRDDPFQEHFTVGWIQDFKLVSKERTHLKLPIYILFDHHGGEIDSSDEHVNTIFNIASGFELNYALQHKTFHEFDINCLYFYFNQTENIFPNNDGWGLMPSASLDVSYLNIRIGYWYGSNFYAPMGSLLYQSVNYNKEWVREINSMPFITANLSYPLYDFVHLNMGSNIYYSIPDKKIQYCYNLSIVFSEGFFLYQFMKK